MNWKKLITVPILGLATGCTTIYHTNIGVLVDDCTTQLAVNNPLLAVESVTLYDIRCDGTVERIDADEFVLYRQEDKELFQKADEYHKRIIKDKEYRDSRRFRDLKESLIKTFNDEWF